MIGDFLIENIPIVSAVFSIFVCLFAQMESSKIDLPEETLILLRKENQKPGNYTAQCGEKRERCPLCGKWNCMGHVREKKGNLLWRQFNHA